MQQPSEADRFIVRWEPSLAYRAAAGPLAFSVIGAFIVAVSASNGDFFGLSSWVGIISGTAIFVILARAALYMLSRAYSVSPRLLVDAKGMTLASGRLVPWSDVRAASYWTYRRNRFIGIFLIEHSEYTASALRVRVNVGFSRAFGWPDIAIPERWFGAPLADVAAAIERFGNIRVTDAPLTRVRGEPADK